MDHGIELSNKRDGFGYEWCMDQFNADTDCKIWDIEAGTQDCASAKYYWGFNCRFWRHRFDAWVIIRGGTDEDLATPSVVASGSSSSSLVFDSTSEVVLNCFLTSLLVLSTYFRFFTFEDLSG